MESVLRVEKLHKRFGEVVALHSIDFELKKGEIHGLVGANGSGKSTFMNILFGSQNIRESGGYSGRIFIDEKEVEIVDSRSSMREGIGMVHQELSLIGELSVSSNIKLNRENIVGGTERFKQFAIVDESRNRKEASAVLSKVGVEIDTGAKAKNYSTNLKQFIEIARELDNEKLKVLILDEPTSSLNVEETNQLLDHLRQIALEGISIIFISHRLDEVTDLCDRVTVLRDGVMISQYTRDEYDIKRIALDMIGKEVVQTAKTSGRRSKNGILKFDRVSINSGDRNHEDISLEVREGEVLGITGLAGHGQEIFGYGIMGLYNLEGSILFEGKRVYPGKDAFQKGIYLLPDERKELGLLIEQSVSENMVFGSHVRRKEFLKHPSLGPLSGFNQKTIDSYVDSMIESLNIKTKSRSQTVRELSGGNQQKVCIARAISVKPKLLFVGEPTRGIDIYSKEIILKMLLKLNSEENTTVVISSGEVSELKRVCDRIAIMYENRVFEIFEGDFESEAFALAMSGRRVE